MRVKTRTPKKRIEQTEKGELSVGTGSVGKEEVTRTPGAWEGETFKNENPKPVTKRGRTVKDDI